MMDPAEFRRAINLGGTGIEPLEAEALLNQVTEQFESLTDRFWKYRTLQTMQWMPELTDYYLWFYGYPVLNTSNFALTEYFIFDGPTLACPINPSDYIINWERGEIFKTRPYRWKQVVNATYDCGLLPVQIPYAVKKALVTQARFITARLSINKIDIKSQSFNKGSAQLMDADYHPYFREVARQNRRRIHGNHG